MALIAADVANMIASLVLKEGEDENPQRFFMEGGGGIFLPNAWFVYTGVAVRYVLSWLQYVALPFRSSKEKVGTSQ
jgi:hypothetical protein